MARLNITKEEFKKKYNYSDDTIRRIDIVYKLFHGQRLTHNDYAWIEDNRFAKSPEPDSVPNNR